MEIENILEFLNKDIVICCVTAFASIVVTAITYYKTAKLKFFELWFDKKTKCFEEFMLVLSSDPAKDSKAFERLQQVFPKVMLYCSEDTVDHLRPLFEFCKKERTPEEVSKFLKTHDIDLMCLRNDLKQCRKFKFE